MSNLIKCYLCGKVQHKNYYKQKLRESEGNTYRICNDCIKKKNRKLTLNQWVEVMNKGVHYKWELFVKSMNEPPYITHTRPTKDIFPKEINPLPNNKIEIIYESRLNYE